MRYDMDTAIKQKLDELLAALERLTYARVDVSHCQTEYDRKLCEAAQKRFNELYEAFQKLI
jgi:hypothetical protein